MTESAGVALVLDVFPHLDHNPPGFPDVPTKSEMVA